MHLQRHPAPETGELSHHLLGVARVQLQVVPHELNATRLLASWVEDDRFVRL
jgi:hypothetical protein